MRILPTSQANPISDAVRAKLAMVIPIIEATVHSLALDRIDRLGGLPKITLHDIAREFREGHGDAGICFEYAVHEALAAEHPLLHPLASEVLEDFCGISSGADSILFGPEKDGRIPVLEATQNSLTDDSVVYVGNRGRPPKLKRYIPQIVRAFRRHEERNKLPRAISGLWKADLFLGSARGQQWVGTSVKITAGALEGAQGLRIGIYPKANDGDTPRKDDNLNLIRLPLPYDSAFMELFYKTFFLFRAFLRADARVPPPVSLPDAEDRLVTQELEARRSFPAFEVMGALADMAQADLVTTEAVADVPVTKTLSEAEGLQLALADDPRTTLVSVTPKTTIEN